MSSEGALVKAADQLHNLKALEESLSTATDPEEVWARFNGGRIATVEMATRLLEATNKQKKNTRRRSSRGRGRSTARAGA